MISNQYITGAKYRSSGPFGTPIRQRIIQCTRCGCEFVHDDDDKYLLALSEFEILHRACQAYESKQN